MRKNRESIERYLHGEMKEDELKNFTFQMVMNPDLRKEIEEVRTIFKTLRTQPDSKTSFSRGWVFYSFLALFFALGCYVMWTYLSPDSTDKTESVETSRPIAETSPFIPNPMFEDLNLRHSNFSVQLTEQPNSENLIPNNARFNFTLKAQLGGVEIPKILLLSIWTNNPDDFKNDNPILSENVEISNQNLIEFNKELNISEGLYYFILTHKDEPVGSGKFEIRHK